MKKETGLMFKAPLVRAILSGQKTQTRRALTPQPMTVADGCTKHWEGTADALMQQLQSIGRKCLMGQPGDRIYVRETWNPDPPCDGTWAYTSWAGCREGQIDGVPERFRTPEHCMYAATSDADAVWTPSIHMPKWAARIWLEITGVRVERLQSISRADIKAEGVEITEPRAFSLYGLNAEQRENMRRTVAAYQFQELWDSTTGRPALPANKNSKRYARVKHWLDTHPDTTGWAANPWVWVIDFKTISTTGRPA